MLTQDNLNQFVLYTKKLGIKFTTITDHANKILIFAHSATAERSDRPSISLPTYIVALIAKQYSVVSFINVDIDEKSTPLPDPIIKATAYSNLAEGLIFESRSFLYKMDNDILNKVFSLCQNLPCLAVVLECFSTTTKIPSKCFKILSEIQGLYDLTLDRDENKQVAVVFDAADLLLLANSKSLKSLQFANIEPNPGVIAAAVAKMNSLRDLLFNGRLPYSEQLICAIPENKPLQNLSLTLSTLSTKSAHALMAKNIKGLNIVSVAKDQAAQNEICDNLVWVALNKTLSNISLESILPTEAAAMSFARMPQLRQLRINELIPRNYFNNTILTQEQITNLLLTIANSPYIAELELSLPLIPKEDYLDYEEMAAKLNSSYQYTLTRDIAKTLAQMPNLQKLQLAFAAITFEPGHETEVIDNLSQSKSLMEFVYAGCDNDSINEKISATLEPHLQANRKKILSRVSNFMSKAVNADDLTKIVLEYANIPIPTTPSRSTTSTVDIARQLDAKKQKIEISSSNVREEKKENPSPSTMAINP